MATQSTWIIQSMQCKPQEGNYTDVVITAFWRCIGVDGGLTASIYGSWSFSTPGDPFTPYADLTEQQVLQWCWDGGLDKTAVEACVDEQIQNQINPPVVTLPLPWQA